VCRIDFRGNFQGQSTAGRNSDRAINALLAGDPSEEREIIWFSGPRTQKIEPTSATSVRMDSNRDENAARQSFRPDDRPLRSSICEVHLGPAPSRPAGVP